MVMYIRDELGSIIPGNLTPFDLIFNVIARMFSVYTNKKKCFALFACLNNIFGIFLEILLKERGLF